MLLDQFPDDRAISPFVVKHSVVCGQKYKKRGQRVPKREPSPDESLTHSFPPKHRAASAEKSRDDPSDPFKSTAPT